MCTNSDFLAIIGILKKVLTILQIAIPIGLLIFGTIDLGKAVIASKEDEVKKATKAFGKRFLYAVGVFAVVWLVTFVLNTVSGLGIKDVDENTTSGWETCWKKIRNS